MPAEAEGQNGTDQAGNVARPPQNASPPSCCNTCQMSPTVATPLHKQRRPLVRWLPARRHAFTETASPWSAGMPKFVSPAQRGAVARQVRMLRPTSAARFAECGRLVGQARQVGHGRGGSAVVRRQVGEGGSRRERRWQATSQAGWERRPFSHAVITTWLHTHTESQEILLRQVQPRRVIQ